MTSTMGCRDAVQRLWAYLDDELDDVDHEAVENHLRFCLRCCGELAFSREVRQFLAIRAETAVPEDAQRRLEDFIDQLDVPNDDNLGAQT